MRTRAGWIALVLTGGLAWTPATVQAQGGLDVSGREAQPIIPLPVYSGRPESGGFYAAFEYVMYRQIRHLDEQVIAYRGLVDVDGSVQQDLGGTWLLIGDPPQSTFVTGPPGPPGTFLGSGVPALRASDLNSKWTYQPGFRSTLGWRFRDGSTFEARWLHVRDARYDASADIIPPGFAVGPNQVDTFLFSPVYNFTIDFAGPGQQLGVGNPGATYGIWNAASEMHISMTQRYNQADFLGKVPVRTSEIARTYFIASGRFAWVWERFKWRTVARDNTGAATPRDVAWYTNTVSNRMYGPALGLQQDLYLGTFGRIGAFSLAFQADAAGMMNIAKQRAKYELGDESASNRKSVTEYTFVPMLNGEIQLTWYPAAGIQVRLSWNSLMFMNTVHATNPVSFNFGNIGRTNDFGPEPFAPNSSLPIWERRAIHYFDGINFGVALSF